MQYYKKKLLIIFLVSGSFWTSNVLAAKFDLTHYGFGVNHGHALNQNIDNVDVKLTAWSLNYAKRFRGVQMQSWGRYGMGINNCYPRWCDSSLAADNKGWKDLFLFEFSDWVELSSIKFSRWRDSDVSYWTGDGDFSWRSRGQETINNGRSKTSRNSRSRKFDFDQDLAPIQWLLIGPQLGESNDAIKLQELEYEVVATPLPAAIWLFGSALAGLMLRGRRQTIALKTA